MVELTPDEARYAAALVRAEQRAKEAEVKKFTAGHASRLVLEKAADVYRLIAEKLEQPQAVTAASLGNWRRVVVQGPYAIKLPRDERRTGAMCLNRWEAEIWNVWRPKFKWEHLCPVVWADPAGHVLVMQRATLDATEDEIRAFLDGDDSYPTAESEDKCEDWGHLDDGRLVVLDYGYACHTEEAIERQRRYYSQFVR